MDLKIKNTGDYYVLYAAIEKEILNQNICLTIEKTFLEPYEILIITLFVIKLTSRNCQITVKASTKVLDYLKAINIVDFCKTNLKQPKTIEAVSSYYAMPIRRVEAISMNEYILKTQEYFKVFCEGKDLGMLNLCLSELINNVYNHSFSSIGAYVFCQYYPKSDEIKLAVADLGIGIPMSVNAYRIEQKEESLSSKDCVVWALKENNTTKSIPQNLGKGLDNVKSFMKANNLNWKLYSENVLVNAYSSGLKYEENPIVFFKGTIAQLTIKPGNLPNIDIQEEIDWFNF